MEEKNENPIETIDLAEQSAKKSTVLFAFRNIRNNKYDAVC